MDALRSWKKRLISSSPSRDDVHNIPEKLKQAIGNGGKQTYGGERGIRICLVEKMLVGNYIMIMHDGS